MLCSPRFHTHTPKGVSSTEEKQTPVGAASSTIPLVNTTSATQTGARPEDLDRLLSVRGVCSLERR